MDSGVTFDEDSDKDIETVEIEEEDWIDHIRRSTADAIDKMEHAKIRCCNKTHRKMKWKLVLRITTSSSERWIKKAAEWNPELSSRYRINRTIGRPKKRWEDDINDFLKQIHDERKTEGPLERKNQNNNAWINIAIDRKEWTRLEEKYTMKSVKWQKELCNVVLEQSSSSTAIKNIVKATAAAVQRLRARWTRTEKIKKYVTGSQLKEIWSTTTYCTKEQNLGSTARATAVLRYPVILLMPGFLLVSWFSLWLPDSLGSSCSVCDVAPNLRIQWICWEFSAATVCAITFLCCFSYTLNSSQVSMHYTLSITVCTCTTCQWASFPSKTDSFLRGHNPDTLVCKVRPSFDWCGTSLSVSLSLSYCNETQIFKFRWSNIVWSFTLYDFHMNVQLICDHLLSQKMNVIADDGRLWHNL